MEARRFVFMADRRLLAKSVEARRFVFMADRSGSAKSVEARRFVLMADGRLLAKSVEARRFCLHGLHGRRKDRCKDDECVAAREARKAITGAQRKL